MALVTRIALLVIGTLAIAAGLSIYAFHRSVRIALIPAALHFPAGGSQPSSVLFGALPSAIHAFALPLLTLGCVRTLRRSCIAVSCLGWCAADLLFELGQRGRHAFLPRGTFDAFDLLGVLLGALLAGAAAVAASRIAP